MRAAQTKSRHESFIAVNVEAIPEELRFLRRWICWNPERRAGKIAKRPIAAKVNDESTWLTFEVARAKAIGEGLGLGFVLGDGIVGVDFDGCVTVDGELHPAVVKAIQALESYAELSPSGTGVHVLTRGTIERSCRLPASATLPARELYDGSDGSGRYFTMTGRRLPIATTRLASGDATQAVLDALVRDLFADGHVPIIALPSTEGSLSDERILELLTQHRNAKKAARVLKGDTSDYSGDSSRADFALCRMLRFYTRDAQQIDRMFRQSGLMRAKWDELHGSETYGAMTIRRAIAAGGPVYVPRTAYKGDEKAKRDLLVRTSSPSVPLWWVVRLHGIGELPIRVLWVIAAYAKAGEAWPSIATIAAVCGVTERRVQEALSILDQAGVYNKGQKRVLRRDGKVALMNLYTLICEAPDVMEPSTPYAELRARFKSTRGDGSRVTRPDGSQHPNIDKELRHILDTEEPVAKLVTKSVTPETERNVRNGSGS